MTTSAAWMSLFLPQRVHGCEKLPMTKWTVRPTKPDGLCRVATTAAVDGKVKCDTKLDWITWYLIMCLQAWWFCCNRCCRFMLQGLSLSSPQATRWEMSGQAIEAHSSPLQFFSALQSLLQCNCPSCPNGFESSKLHVCFSWEVEFLSQMLLWPPSELLLVLCYKSR